MSKRGLILIGLLLALVAFSEVITPLAASFLLDRAMNKATPAKQMGVSARSFPGITMWMGHFDSVTAGAAGASIDGFSVQEMRMSLDGARLDMSDLMMKNRVTVRDVRNLEMVMKITEKDLAGYIGARVKEAKNTTVKITADNIQLRSEIDLGIAKLSAGVDGRIVGDAKSIRFISDKLEVKNTGGINFGAVFAEIPLIDMTRLPFKAGVRKVVMETGAMTIVFDNHF